MSDVTITLDRLPAELRRLDVDPAALDLSRAMRESSDYLSERAAERFESGHDPDGGSWPALRPATVKRKGHAQILVDKGLLAAAMSAFAAPGAIRDIGPRSLEHGADTPYGAFHQEGTPTLPKREFAGVSDQDADHIADLVADEAVRQLLRG
jgi:phage gpG-like protein